MAYRKRNPMKNGEVHKSNQWGDVTVIDYRNAKDVLCRFEDTGNEAAFHASSIRRGVIRDEVEYKRLSEERKASRKAEAAKNYYEAVEGAKQRSMAEISDRVFESEHCGPFTVTKYDNADNVTVTFCNTGHEVKTSKATIVGCARPRIRDPLAPTVFGVGCQGVGPHAGYVEAIETQPHATWRAMLRRCYGPEHRPAYEDVTVCEEWLNFQTFADWYEENHPGTAGLELDKDIKIKGNRVYRPEACQFVTKAENQAAR